MSRPSSTTTTSTSTSTSSSSRRKSGEYSQIGQEHEQQGDENEQQGDATQIHVIDGAPSTSASSSATATAAAATASASSQASNVWAIVMTELQTLVSTLYASSDGGTRAVLTMGILAVAVVLVGIWTVRVILRHWVVVLMLGVGSFVILGVALNLRNVYYNTLPQHDNNDDIVDSRMQRINREREESEAMASQAGQMMLDIDRQHLQEFLQHHPHQATYEEWIADLHPDNVVVKGDNNTDKKIEIDHRFYVPDSDHLAMWKEQMAVSETRDTSL